MNTEFGEKLSSAIEKSLSDVNRFVWKGAKQINSKGNFVQEEIRLVDATEEKLREYYQHCLTMLNNTDQKNPGRNILLKEIEDQRNRCGVELFYRDIYKNNGTTRYSVIDALKTAAKNANISTVELKTYKLKDFITVNPDYQNLPYEMVLDGAQKKLGRFNRSHITMSFILKQGLWFSKEEKKHYDQLYKTFSEKLEAVKKDLKIPANTYKLHFDERSGLSVKELKAILPLKVKKYDEMTDEQLLILRNKLLFAFEDMVSLHILQWNTRLKQIEQVANLKGYKLK
jgi:hypothetical protein